MDTSASLLDGLRLAPQDEAWRQLVELYSPLIRNWLLRNGAAPGDVDDVAQEVLLVVVRRIGEFRREPRTGAFRNWLRTITVNCLRDHWRGKNKLPAVGGSDFGEFINQLEDPHSGVSDQWSREHDEHVIRYLLNRIRPRFAVNTWRAFQRFALENASADEVARELDISPNAVFIAKSRVMAMLRRQGRGLID